MPYANIPEFLVNAPLYRIESFTGVATRREGPGSAYMPAPEVLDRVCSKCGPTKWKFTGGVYQGRVPENTLSQLNYQCRNCETTYFSVWTRWWRDAAGPGPVSIQKAGQFPRLDVNVPKEFEKALGPRRDLYVRGMNTRHAGYGIGAMGYFRRVIEETTDEMLGLLEVAMKEGSPGDPAALETLASAKAGTRFEDKVKIAGEVMPAHLRPGGVNPFADLYELISIGLHGLTDEECCDIVDGMDESLKFIYTQLKSHTADVKAYQEAAARISFAVAKLKGRRSN